MSPRLLFIALILLLGVEGAGLWLMLNHQVVDVVRVASVADKEVRVASVAVVDFSEVDADTFDVGTRVQMRFRLKFMDKRRGMRHYFWKAVPVAGSE